MAPSPEDAERHLRRVAVPDLEAFLDLFEDQATVEFEGQVHRGRAALRTLYATLRVGLVEQRAELGRCVGDGTTLPFEWWSQSRHAHGRTIDVEGVDVQSLDAGRITWARVCLARMEQH